MNKSFQSLYINNEKRRLVPAALYILIAFMGVSGAVFSFVSCFNFGIKLWFYLIWIVLALSVSILYLVDWFRDKLLVMFLLGSMTYVLFCFDRVLISAVQACNIVIQDINSAYSMGIRMIVLPERFALDVGPETALALLAVIVTFLTAYFVLGRSSVVGCLCITMPFSIFGIFFDIFPRLEFLLLSITFWIIAVVFHASGKRGKRIADGAVYNGLFAAAGIWIIYLALGAVIPEQGYERSTFLESAKIYIEQNVSALTEYSSKGRTGIGDGRFGDQSEVYFTGETVLEVTFPYFGQNIYLRATEYNEYLGNQWVYNDAYFQNFFDNSYEDLGIGQQPQNITASILKNLENELEIYGVDMETYEKLVTKYQIQIRNFTYSDVPFAPYGAEFDGGRMKTDVMPRTDRSSVSKYTVYTAGDLRRFCEVFPAGKFLSYWNTFSSQFPTLQNTTYYQTLLAEEEYASFVRKAYTQVPEGLRDVLNRYAPGVVEYDCVSEMEFAEGIRQFFADNYQYTLAPGVVPEGIDGVEYFLNENRQGYCVYFASAATLIFRQAGIPARYVEGFIITPDMIQNMDADGIAKVLVSDDKAHAWPEIYIAGYGWIPVEVTPGFYNENVEWEENKPQANENDWIVEDDEEDEDTETESNIYNENEEDEEGGVLEGQFAKILAVVILALAAGVCCLCGLHGRKNRKKFTPLFDAGSEMDNRNRMLLAWQYVESLLLFKKVSIPDNLTVLELKEFLKGHFECFSKEDWDGRIDCIMEVYFGNKMPDNEETDNTVEMAKAFGSEIYTNLKWMGKLRLRIVHGL